MINNHEIQDRKSMRLKGYDYSQLGAYFITICTQNRECLFGEIFDGKMVLTDAGEHAYECLINIQEHFPHVKSDIFVVMPNHVHIIIIIDASAQVKANNYSPLQHEKNQKCGTSKIIGAIVRGFKIGVTKWFHENTDIRTVWQRNYYEHIIRNEHELNKIREYIQGNPLNWDSDSNNPLCTVNASEQVGANNYSPYILS
ncbi:transposase [Candidatus Magnetomonas plexicatena]|uniref:transposase n=1 Tax=Candidatus Magnetomonas plexicatena TaxID=2552947 RepID=UPI004032F747